MILQVALTQQQWVVFSFQLVSDGFVVCLSTASAVFCFMLFLCLPFPCLGVGVDGGNDKDWEANACKIQLIKQKGKVKALDEEVHSTYCTAVLLSLEGSSRLTRVLNVTPFTRKHCVSSQFCVNTHGWAGKSPLVLGHCHGVTEKSWLHVAQMSHMVLK